MLCVPLLHPAGAAHAVGAMSGTSSEGGMLPTPVSVFGGTGR